LKLKHLLENAVLVDFDPPRVEVGGLRIEGGQIVARGAVTVAPEDEVLDCGGVVVLPVAWLDVG
jgi:cytosine/adenosine deaminase-related metal-dependent hydrolase